MPPGSGPRNLTAPDVVRSDVSEVIGAPLLVAAVVTIVVVVGSITLAGSVVGLTEPDAVVMSVLLAVIGGAILEQGISGL